MRRRLLLGSAAVAIVVGIWFGYEPALNLYRGPACISEGGMTGVGPYGGDLHCCDGLTGSIRIKKLGKEIPETGGSFCVRPGCQVLQIDSGIESTVLRCSGEPDTPFRALPH